MAGRSFRLTAFVLGGAECIWADLESAQSLCSPDIVVAVNDIGIDYPGRIDHWVSYHSDFLGKWSRQRAERGLPDIQNYWTGKGGPTKAAPKGTKTVNAIGGSSGMLATFAALKSGATKVILCGIPMDAEMPHYHNHKKSKPWTDALKYHKHWKAAAQDEFRDRVRSMSGWTATLLGTPTREWLEG